MILLVLFCAMAGANPLLLNTVGSFTMVSTPRMAIHPRMQVERDEGNRTWVVHVLWNRRMPLAVPSVLGSFQYGDGAGPAGLTQWWWNLTLHPTNSANNNTAGVWEERFVDVPAGIREAALRHWIAMGSPGAACAVTLTLYLGLSSSFARRDPPQLDPPQPDSPQLGRVLLRCCVLGTVYRPDGPSGIVPRSDDSI